MKQFKVLVLVGALQLLLFFEHLVIRNEAKMVTLDLKTMSELARARIDVYFVYMRTPDLRSRASLEEFDAFWESMESFRPLYIWATLECSSKAPSDVCLELMPKKRMRDIDKHGVRPTFLVISESYSNGRAMEFFQGQSFEELFVFFREASFRPTVPFAYTEKPPQRSDQPQMNPKASLAILVLATQGFARPDVWCPFLKEASANAAIRIFVHDKQRSTLGESEPSDSYYCHEEKDNVVHVPTVLTQRGTISLVRANIHMIQYASMHYGGASSYILVSGDSVPLLPADELVKSALSKKKDEHVSLFELHQQQADYETSARFGMLRSPGLLGDEKLLKVKQWCLLSEQAALALASPTNDYTREFELMDMADEHYFVTIAQKLGIPFDFAPIMFDSWPKEMAKRPNDLQNVTSDMFAATGHIFARKVTNETHISLNWIIEKKTRLDSTKGDEL